jgi:HprK-related kinase A
VIPMCRPVSLKNESIRIIQEFAPGVAMGAPSHDTTKGTVAHMRVPKESVARSQETAIPAWIVFPKYQPAAVARLEDHSKGSAFMKIADNTFNYSMLGRAGFQTAADLVNQCDCYEFSYSDLNDAIRIFDQMANR